MRLKKDWQTAALLCQPLNRYVSFLNDHVLRQTTTLAKNNDINTKAIGH